MAPALGWHFICGVFTLSTALAREPVKFRDALEDAGERKATAWVLAIYEHDQPKRRQLLAAASYLAVVNRFRYQGCE